MENVDGLDDQAVEFILKCHEKLNSCQKINQDISNHLRLSIEKLLKYGDYNHFKIPDREFLEDTIKKNNEFLIQSDKTAILFNEFIDKWLPLLESNFNKRD